MADADSAIDSSAKVLEAIGQLRTGGLILVGVITVCALIAWGLWLRNQRANRIADAAAAKLENDAKEKRADRYTAALSGLQTEIVTMRKDTAAGSQAIQKLVTTQTSSLIQSVASLEAGHVQRQGDLSALMRELLDRQKGVINLEDSLRIVELNFRLEVKPSVLTTIEASIRNNHYTSDPDFIRDRFLARINLILHTAFTALDFYTLSVKPAFFFPADAEKHYELANTLWASLKAIHEISEDLTDAAVVTKRVQQAQIRAEDIINSFVNSRVTQIRDNNDDDGIQPRPAPGTN